MIVEAEAAVRSTSALSLSSLAPIIHGVVMTGLAVVASASCADEHGDVAAVHALVVDELIPVLRACLLAEAKLLLSALLAKQVFLADLRLGAHGLEAVLQASKVGFLALVALVEGARVHRQLLQLAEKDVVLVAETALLVQTFLDRLFNGHFLDLFLVLEALQDEVCQLRHLVVYKDLLLAARAVQVAKRDLQCRVLALEHLGDAAGVENMSACQAHTWLLSQLARVANAAQLVLLSVDRHFAEHEVTLLFCLS